MDEVLIDTSVLIYMHDRADATKHQRSTDVVQTLVASRTGRLSVRILARSW